jgi:streptogrisin C
MVRRFIALAGIAAGIAAGLVTAQAAARPLAQPADGAPAPAVQSAEVALAQDAEAYARLNEIGADEARSRLQAELETVPVTRAIAVEFGERLAGISVEHRPDFRIRVLLTGNNPVAPRSVVAGGITVPIDFQTGARATREQVVAAERLRGDAIRARLPGTQGMGYDPRTGELVVLVDLSAVEGHDETALRAAAEEAAGVPARLRVLGRALDRDSNGVEGGSRVEGQNPGDPRRFVCTTGFVVTDGRRNGVITAAHCPDELTYVGGDGSQIPLAFAGQWGAQFQDVQVNVGAVGDRPIFFANPGRREARPVTEVRRRNATRAGDTVCHRGEASGYSCSEVDLTDYAPPGDLCGGTCHPVWTTVTGPGCRGGDSGGPVFAGTVAFGILKGGNYAANGRCNFYYYMSIDYLPPGWSLLLEQPAVIASQTALRDRASP